MQPIPDISVVVPCHNEENNLRPLVSAVDQVLSEAGFSYEIVVTDDRSTDASWAVLQSLAAGNPRVRGQRFAENRGQSAAMWAGLRAARAPIVVTMDADLQNDPLDLPLLIAGLRDVDCVCGSRVAARAAGDTWVKRMSSRIANAVRNWVSGEDISDAGCCYRAFKRECLREIRFFNGGHRFLPTLLRMDGYTVKEVPIRHNPRASGESHYGVWNRLFKSFLDLLAVRWMKRRAIRYQVEAVTESKEQ